MKKCITCGIIIDFNNSPTQTRWGKVYLRGRCRKCETEKTVKNRQVAKLRKMTIEELQEKLSMHQASIAEISAEITSRKK